MAFIKCSVNGCNTRLQPIMKPVLKDRSTWIYPECDRCFRPVCAMHSSELNGEVICAPCLKKQQEHQSDLIELGIKPSAQHKEESET